jgi:hypothetical protein
MIEPKRIAAGVARSLLEESGRRANIRRPIEEAFRRGYQLGRSIRPATAPPAARASRRERAASSWPAVIDANPGN